jgi:group I intron endonuclease
MFTIYLIVNKLNGKVYVGQTNQPLHRRWGLHKARARKNEGYTAHLYNAIRKYGIENFDIRPIATCETETWADYFETLYILIYDSMNPEVGYNMTSGGDKPHPTPEMRERQRQKLLGRKATPEQKQRQSDSLKLAYKEGRYSGNRGGTWPEEAKKTASENRSGPKHWNFNHKVCSEELLFLWNNNVKMKDIAKHFGLSADTIKKRIKSIGLPYKIYKGYSGKNSPSYKELDEEKLTSLFHQDASLREIGRQLGTSHNVISQRIKSLGLTRN